MQRRSQHRARSSNLAGAPGTMTGVARAQAERESHDAPAQQGSWSQPDLHGAVTIAVRLDGSLRSITLRGYHAALAAAIERGARLVTQRLGFDAEVQEVPALVARISLPNAAPHARVQRRFAALAGDLLQVGMDATADASLPIGCIPGVWLSSSGGGDLAAFVCSEKVDAAGGRALFRVAEAISVPLARLAECAGAVPVELRAISRSWVKARCRFPAGDVCGLDPAPAEGRGRAERGRGAPWAELARALDQHQPALAAQHNEYLIEGMAGAATELGLGGSSWETEARRFAGRWGSCEPLVRWVCVRGELIGDLRLPLELAQLSLETAGHGGAVAAEAKQRSVNDSLRLLACVGLSASIAFFSQRWRGLTGLTQPRNLPPPPLRAIPGAGVSGARAPGASRPAALRSSESGVHPRVTSPVEEQSKAG